MHILKHIRNQTMAHGMRYFIGRGDSSIFPYEQESHASYSLILECKHSNLIVGYVAKRKSDGLWCVVMIGGRGFMNDQKVDGMSKHQAIMSCKGYKTAWKALQNKI